MTRRKLQSLVEGAYLASLRERAEQVKSGFWKDKRGRQIALTQLEDSHLYYILKMYMDARAPFDVNGLAEKMARPLLKEAERRGMMPPEKHDRFELIELD